jgi:hypothetical protein
MRDERFKEAFDTFIDVFQVTPQFFEEREGYLILGRDYGKLKLRLYEVSKIFNKEWEYTILAKETKPIVSFGKYIEVNGRRFKAEVEYIS